MHTQASGLCKTKGLLDYTFQSGEWSWIANHWHANASMLWLCLCLNVYDVRCNNYCVCCRIVGMCDNSNLIFAYRMQNKPTNRIFLLKSTKISELVLPNEALTKFEWVTETFIKKEKKETERGREKESELDVDLSNIWTHGMEVNFELFIADFKSIQIRKSSYVPQW